MSASKGNKIQGFGAKQIPYYHEGLSNLKGNPLFIYDSVGLAVSITTFNASNSAALNLTDSTTNTTNVQNALTLIAKTTGAMGSNFGAGINFQAIGSNGTLRAAGKVASYRDGNDSSFGVNVNTGRNGSFNTKTQFPAGGGLITVPVSAANITAGVTFTEGYIIDNSTTHQLEWYNGTSRMPLYVYTTRGDMNVAGASAIPQRLALGTAAQRLASNGTDLIWRDTAAVISSVGNLSPLFTSLLSGGGITFTQSSVAAKTVFANTSSSSATPSFTANPSIGGNMDVLNYYSTSTTPAIAAGAGAGTTPTISITGTNEGGNILLTTGTLPTASAVIATITLSASYAFPHGMSVILYPGNALTAALSGTSMTFVSPGTSSWTMTSGTTQLVGATQYLWYYKVEGY